MLLHATRDQRILVTRDVKDFVPLAREWAEAGRSHAGCLLVTRAVRDPEAIVRSIDRTFEQAPDQSDWVGRVQFV